MNYPPPPFPTGNSCQAITFRRLFGPVATSDGIELRLRFNIKVQISHAGGIMLDNGVISMAVNPCRNSCALVHPNGKVYKAPDRVDMLVYDGMKRNNYM